MAILIRLAVILALAIAALTGQAWQLAPGALHMTSTAPDAPACPDSRGSSWRVVCRCAWAVTGLASRADARRVGDAHLGQTNRGEPDRGEPDRGA